MIFWFIILGVLIYFLLGENIDLGKFTNRATRLLDERLAKGEISIEEYQEIRDTLKESVK